MKLAEYKSLLTTLQRPGAMSDQIARKWFVTQARSLNTRPRSILTSEQENLTNKIKLGYLYLFFYEPKYKSNLKYFDKYPLTIPIELKENGFTGLNLHYISPTQRLILIENLRPLIMNESVSNRQRLRISHRILQSSRRYKYYKPCVKNYLYNNRVRI